MVLQPLRDGAEGIGSACTASEVCKDTEAVWHVDRHEFTGGIVAAFGYRNPAGGDNAGGVADPALQYLVEDAEHHDVPARVEAALASARAGQGRGRHR